MIRCIGEMSAWAGVLAITVAGATTGYAADQPTPDRWLPIQGQNQSQAQGHSQYPHSISIRQAAAGTNAFAQFNAEVLAGGLKIVWRPEGTSAAEPVQLFTSADEPGHWPARDWRLTTMERRANGVYDAAVAVEDLDVPVVYFVVSGLTLTNGTASVPAQARGPTSKTPILVSPMRVCVPRALGLEQPTKVFWPFIDGFEEGLTGWRALGDRVSFTLAPAQDARTGAGALALSIPEHMRSVTIGTARIRGWQIKAQNATGIRLHLRTGSGEGRARFSLLANAHSDRQLVGVWLGQPRVTADWQRVDLAFDQLQAVPLHEIDLFTVEFIAPGPATLLVDDVQLLGPWRLELK